MEDLKDYWKLFREYVGLANRFLWHYLNEHIEYKIGVFYSKLMGTFVNRPKLFKHVGLRATKWLGKSLAHMKICDELKPLIEAKRSEMEYIERFYGV